MFFDRLYNKDYPGVGVRSGVILLYFSKTLHIHSMWNSVGVQGSVTSQSHIDKNEDFNSVYKTKYYYYVHKSTKGHYPLRTFNFWTGNSIQRGWYQPLDQTSQVLYIVFVFVHFSLENFTKNLCTLIFIYTSPFSFFLSDKTEQRIIIKLNHILLACQQIMVKLT